MQLPCPYNYVLVNNHQSVVYTVLVDLNNTLHNLISWLGTEWVWALGYLG
jgi:hypothetical protein